MAKKKAVTRDKSPKKSKGKPWWRRLLHFMVLPPVRRLLLVIIIVAVLIWQWAAITLWANSIGLKTLELFGWGLALIDIILAGLVVVVWRRNLSTFIRHWNRWLSGIAFILTTWGILAFFNLGGSIGLGIIGYPYSEIIGGLRLLGLAIIGTILFVPRPSFHVTARFISWLGKQFKRRPAPKPEREPQQPLYPVTGTSPADTEKLPGLEKPSMLPDVITPRPARVKREKEVAVPGLAPASSQQELRQVAQEVWKKYGQSAELVTIDGWKLPPIDILDRSPEVELSQADNMQRARLIEDALASYGVDSKVVQINAGPTVTQFGVEPGWDRKMKEIKEKDKEGNVRVRQEEVSKIRVKVERITSLANDLALALAAPSIRIEAPVPGKSIVGVEVPNKISSMVSLRGVIETSAFQKIEARSKLCIALGKGAGGEAIAADLSKMPHLLIAGATGSGKTVCLNTIICCLLLHNTPNEVRFIMVDPKRVELTTFNSVPHLSTPVIVDANKAVDALRWLNQEMEKRYRTLAAASVRNIDGFNKSRQGKEKMSFLVLIIDELADLMMTGGDEVERILCLLAQKSRAVGIHLVVATQRPSVDVVTGLIKANFPTRISFAVTSQVDSRTILDIAGAEKLLGSGDMLYMPTEAAKPKRLQGCYVSDAEAERLVYFWGNQRSEEEAQLNVGELIPPAAAGKKGGIPDDPLLETARQLAEEHQHISTSYLQRKLRIGYPRAARIMEQLEEEMDKGEGEGGRGEQL